MRSDLLAALKLRDDVLRRRAAAPQPEVRRCFCATRTCISVN